MATNAPSTVCFICGKPNDYRVIEHHRPPGSPMVFGPTDWQLVPHDHTKEQVDAWLERIMDKGEPHPFFTKIEPR